MRCEILFITVDFTFNSLIQNIDNFVTVNSSKNSFIDIDYGLLHIILFSVSQKVSKIWSLECLENVRFQNQ